MLFLVMSGSLAANVGAIEVVGVPDATHLGVYPYVGASLVIPHDRVTFIPGLSIEWSPDESRWGFVATGTADIAIAARAGFDINVSLIHDQSGGELGDAIFLAGAGPGVSLFFGRYTVSAYVSAFRGINVDGWSIVPGINAAMSL